MECSDKPFDRERFRSVLGCYPTGVCIVTAIGADGKRTGMVVGSFVSLSLEPPLVGFLPGKCSESWAEIERTGRFCVNVLGAHQLDLCNRFAGKNADKFAELAHGCSPSGQPLFEDAVAWIDCSIDRIVDVGDHWLVVGAVEALDMNAPRDPLLFFKRGYHTVDALG
ncbi:flavin reductase family protein [Sphingobium ummariense]